MLSINLLPRDLKRGEGRTALPYNKLYVAAVVVILLGLHVCLFSIAVVKKIQIMSLKASWAKVAPQSKDAVAVKAEIKDLNNKIMAMKGFLTRKVIVTELLSSLNAAVPKGLWLERLSLTTEGGLVLQGSVVSLTQNEMTIIGKFLQEIKSNKTFAELFSKIDLNSVQRRTIKTFDVVDFVVLGELKK